MPEEKIQQLKNELNLLDVQDVMELTGWSQATVLKRMDDEDFPVIKIGKRNQVLFESLKEYLKPRKNYKIITFKTRLNYFKLREVKIMFNRKSNQIKYLIKQVNKLNSEKKELIEDFILILQNIQQTNNENLQWKKKQKTINNAIDLAIENYEMKMVD